DQKAGVALDDPTDRSTATGYDLVPVHNFSPPERPGADVPVFARCVTARAPKPEEYRLSAVRFRVKETAARVARDERDYARDRASPAGGGSPRSCSLRGGGACSCRP